MAGQSVTLHLPGELYERLRQQAEQAHRSVEDEVLDLVLSSLPGEPLPADLAAAADQLVLLSDDDLWRAARSHLAAEDSARMEDLHLKRQRVGLTTGEEAELAELTHAYEHAVLLRARATQLLAERGCDISSLAPNP